jgi:phosphoglycolate phosphatase
VRTLGDVDAGDDDVVLFDLDGVLADSRAAIAGCINHALAAGGHAVRDEIDLHRYIGPPLPLAFAELLAEPVSSEAVAGCIAAYRERYAAASLTDTVVTPGIADALARLAARRRLGVATSKPRAFAEPLLDVLGLRGYFDAVAGPDLGTPVENKATTVGAALRALGATRGAMVGDTAFDMVAARAHGLRAVGVTWGIGSSEELLEAGAEVLVAEPAELLPALSPRAATP